MNEEVPTAGKTKKDCAEDTSCGIGCGVFLLLAGLILLAKELGWIPFNADWLVPAILIAWGCRIIYKALKKK
jgi:hypothetical protein